MDYRDNRQRWAESHQVVHFYAGQWCTFTPALTQRVIAGAAEMAVIGRTFLITMGRADGAVHVEHHAPRRIVVVNPVDPRPRQVRSNMKNV